MEEVFIVKMTEDELEIVKAYMKEHSLSLGENER